MLHYDLSIMPVPRLHSLTHSLTHFSRFSRRRLSPSSDASAGDIRQDPQCPTATRTGYISASSPKKLHVPVSLGTLLLLVLELFPITVQAAVKEFQQRNAYAVVIGISQYREEVIPKVPYATKDAGAVAQLLETQAGIPKTHIKLLTDAKATIGDFRNHFGDWLRMRVKADSTVYVYYAGHGTPDPKTGEAFLVPWEGHPDFPSGLYPLNELYATLNKLPAKEVVVLLDSCFSGAAGRSVLAKGARPMVISVENPLLAGGKVIVLAAATGNQISSDYDKAGHGLFTSALLTGLQGEADADHDGIVTLKEVFPFVRDRVTHTAVDELNREQTPVLMPEEEMIGPRLMMPLAHVPMSGSGMKPGAQASSKTEEPKPIQEARARPYEGIALAPLPKPEAGYPAIALVFSGLDTDKVGSGFQPTPNGEPDGHFVLDLDTGGKPMLVTGISLGVPDRLGRTGKAWSTTGDGWILGVERDGKRLNPSDRTVRDGIKGRLRYELFANGPTWFVGGQSVTVEVWFGDGHVVSTSTLIE